MILYVHIMYSNRHSYLGSNCLTRLDSSSSVRTSQAPPPPTESPPDEMDVLKLHLREVWVWATRDARDGEFYPISGGGLSRNGEF